MWFKNYIFAKNVFGFSNMAFIIPFTLSNVPYIVFSEKLVDTTFLDKNFNS